MHLVQIFQSYWEAQVHRRHKILDLEVHEFHVVSELLNDSSEFSRCQVGVDFVSSTCAHELARSEDERRAARLANPHHDSVEPLWIIFGISSSVVDCLEIEFAS